MAVKLVHWKGSCETQQYTLKDYDGHSIENQTIVDKIIFDYEINVF